MAAAKIEPTVRRLVSSTGVLADDKKEFAERERKAIATALAECHGRVSGPQGAAAKLGIPHQTLASKIESLGIDKRQFKVTLQSKVRVRGNLLLRLVSRSIRTVVHERMATTSSLVF
jgi:hypothetical protein